ncbi:hypothetical protein ACJX0J_031001, partial [Zea mays]
KITCPHSTSKIERAINPDNSSISYEYTGRKSCLNVQKAVYIAHTLCREKKHRDMKSQFKENIEQMMDENMQREGDHAETYYIIIIIILTKFGFRFEREDVFFNGTGVTRAEIIFVRKKKTLVGLLQYIFIDMGMWHAIKK